MAAAVDPAATPGWMALLGAARSGPRVRGQGMDGARAPKGDDDDALLARFAKGDQLAARTLADRHTGRILALGTRMLKDTAEAEDVAQEAMLRAWKNAADWRPGEAKFSTWLHKVALNLCYDRLRKRQTKPLEDAPEPMDDRASAQEEMEADERVTVLQAALDELPDRQRLAIQLSHYQELSNPETAEMLGVSVEAVESLLSRGRRALRTRLASQRALLMED